MAAFDGPGLLRSQEHGANDVKTSVEKPPARLVYAAPA